MSINNKEGYWLLGKSGVGTSIVTAVKNRNENLRKTVPSWLKVRDVDEIIIVDWNSDEKVAPLFEDIDDPRLKIIRLEGYDGWRTCRAFNLAMRCATYDKMLRLDSDYLVEPGIVGDHPLEEGSFITGYWANARNLNETFTNGLIYLYKEDFIKVNGYNESFQMYGYDDDDFYNRLEALPLKKHAVNNNYVYHIPHHISLRSSEFDLVNKVDIINKKAHTDLTIRTNDYLSKNTLKWGSNIKAPDYALKSAGTNYSIAQISDYKESYYNEEQIKEAQTHAKTILINSDCGLHFETIKEKLKPEEIDELFLCWNRIYAPKPKNENSFHLLISLYNEEDVERCYELIKCISTNLLNENIGEVTVFYDAEKDGLSPHLIQTFLYKHKINHKYIGGKPKFKDLFDYANNNELGLCIIANSDILYDDSLSLIADKDLKNKLLCLSRRNYNNETKDYELITWDNGTPQFFSADSWIFETPFNYTIRDDVRLGTMHSEPFLANHLYRQRYLKIYNPCLDVRSFHIQRGKSEMERMNTDKDGIAERDELYKNEYQKLCGSDPISGVVWCKSTDLGSARHTQYKASRQYLFVDASQQNITNFELDSIAKYGEQIDRNVWIYCPDNKPLADLIGLKNNNINVSYNDDFKKSVKQFKEKKKFQKWISTNQVDIWLTSETLLDHLDLGDYRHLDIPKVIQPKISIITPSYNAAKYIEEAILSVLDQSYGNFEHIIMDGGSTDGTVDIIKKYDHLIWVSEPDEGQSHAMNKGFERSTGDIIGYLNADDFYNAGCFEQIIPFFEDGAAFLTGKVVMKEGDNTYWINNPSNSQSRWLVHWAEQAFPYNPVGYFYRREVQEKVGGYVKDNHYSMDFEFLLEMSGLYSITRTHSELGVFRFVKGNKSSFIMEQSDFWSDKKFGYVKNYLSSYPETFQKEYLSKRDYYYSIFKNQNNQLQNLVTANSLKDAPDYLITMKIQRNIILEYDNVVLPDKDIEVIGLCILNRYDELYLHNYFQYYKKMGVDCFYIFAQGDKNDQIIDILEDYDNIKYYSLNFDAVLLRNNLLSYVLNKYLHNKWIVYTSVLEYLQVPLPNYIKDIRDLINILEANSFSGVVSNNVEMLPGENYNPSEDNSMDYIKDFKLTSLSFTKQTSPEVRHNFPGSQLVDRTIQRFQNDAISGITKKDREITNIPVFKNNSVIFTSENLPAKVRIADFNVYCKVYTLTKHLYLDLLNDDYKYYQVFDLDYSLEEKIADVKKIIRDFETIEDKDIEKQLLDRGILSYSSKLLEYAISHLVDIQNGQAKDDKLTSIEQVKDLVTYVLSSNALVSNTHTVVSTTVPVTTHEDQRKLDQVYNSYSWKIGNGIMKVVDFFIGWMPFAKKAKGK